MGREDPEAMGRAYSKDKDDKLQLLPQLLQLPMAHMN